MFRFPVHGLTAQCSSFQLSLILSFIFDRSWPTQLFSWPGKHCLCCGLHSNSKIIYRDVSSLESPPSHVWLKTFIMWNRKGSSICPLIILIFQTQSWFNLVDNCVRRAAVPIYYQLGKRKHFTRNFDRFCNVHGRIIGPPNKG